jgi:hypothetical protein
MTQPSVELARGLAFDSFALAKESPSALKLIGFERRLVELADGRQQFRQLVLGKFFVEQGLLAAFVLQGFLVALAICFSAAIHSASPSADYGPRNKESSTVKAGFCRERRYANLGHLPPMFQIGQAVKPGVSALPLR